MAYRLHSSHQTANVAAKGELKEPRASPKRNRRARRNMNAEMHLILRLFLLVAAVSINKTTAAYRSVDRRQDNQRQLRWSEDPIEIRELNNDLRSKHDIAGLADLLLVDRSAYNRQPAATARQSTLSGRYNQLSDGRGQSGVLNEYDSMDDLVTGTRVRPHLSSAPIGRSYYGTDQANSIVDELSPRPSAAASSSSLSANDLYSSSDDDYSNQYLDLDSPSSPLVLPKISLLYRMEKKLEQEAKNADYQQINPIFRHPIDATSSEVIGDHKPSTHPAVGQARHDVNIVANPHHERAVEIKRNFSTLIDDDDDDSDKEARNDTIGPKGPVDKSAEKSVPPQVDHRKSESLNRLASSSSPTEPSTGLKTWLTSVFSNAYNKVASYLPSFENQQREQLAVTVRINGSEIPTTRVGSKNSSVAEDNGKIALDSKTSKIIDKHDEVNAPVSKTASGDDQQNVKKVEETMSEKSIGGLNLDESEKIVNDNNRDAGKSVVEPIAKSPVIDNVPSSAVGSSPIDDDDGKESEIPQSSFFSQQHHHNQHFQGPQPAIDESYDILVDHPTVKIAADDSGDAKVNLMRHSSLVMPIKSSDEYLVKPTASESTQSDSNASLLGRYISAAPFPLMGTIGTSLATDQQKEQTMYTQKMHRSYLSSSTRGALSDDDIDSYTHGVILRPTLNRLVFEPAAVGKIPDSRNNDFYFLLSVAGFLCAACVLVLAAGSLTFRRNKKVQEIFFPSASEYPTYGVVGPNNMIIGGKCGGPFVGGYANGPFGPTGNVGKLAPGGAMIGPIDKITAKHFSDLYNPDGTIKPPSHQQNHNHHNHQGFKNMISAARKSSDQNHQNFSSSAVGNNVLGHRASSGFLANQNAAQMYHYQHQKQQMIISDQVSTGRHTSASDTESEDEDDGSYTVYECPGLASAHEMEIKNPLFNDDQNP